MSERLPVQPNDFEDLSEPLIPSERRVRLPEDLTLEERAEMVENSMLAGEVTAQRQADQLETYGKTDTDLEAEADAWLKAAGFDDLVEGKN